ILAFIVVGGLAGVLARQFGAPGVLDTLDGPGALSIDTALARDGVVGAIALPLFQTYVVPFEITGILLLVAIVGALALAKRNV
ncbi:MAG TPA: NADH-quinone oxidoreductase subunit J, partial [Longimicrobiales bacterium]|nr:NADH-quinone oxidoreductase subunit J [Longimicrobiales bacterium]